MYTRNPLNRQLTNANGVNFFQPSEIDRVNSLLVTMLDALDVRPGLNLEINQDRKGIYDRLINAHIKLNGKTTSAANLLADITDKLSKLDEAFAILDAHLNNKPLIINVINSVLYMGVSQESFGSFIPSHLSADEIVQKVQETVATETGHAFNAKNSLDLSDFLTSSI